MKKGRYLVKISKESELFCEFSSLSEMRRVSPNGNEVVFVELEI